MTTKPTVRPWMSLHAASRLLKLPGKVIIEEFERLGLQVHRVGHGRKVRVRLDEDDLAVFQARAATNGTIEDTDEKLDIVEASIRDEFGLPRKRQSAKRSSRTSP